MQIVEGKRLGALDQEGFDGLREAAQCVTVDVGTGDARTAYRLAKADPERLVVGVDPAWQRMSATSVRARRKPAKGGAANLVLVNAAIESAPPELRGTADEVTALMPWGKLLRGVVLGEADVCRGLRTVAKAGASLEVTVGTSIWRPPVPLEIRDLPELTPEYVRGELAPLLRDAGWEVADARLVTSAELEAIGSSWARRLGSSSPEAVMHVRATAVEPAGAPAGT